MTNASYTDPASKDRQIILFGRYPVPGQTKTRLIPTLGPVGAAQLQRQLTLKSLDTLMAVPGVSVAFCYTGGTRLQVNRWLKRYPVELPPQIQGHLGQRMQKAMERALDKGYKQVVLVGTDIPDMREKHIHAAFEALENNDLVLGPSRDGGYWLIGLQRKADIFNGIDWGGADVFNQTVAAAHRQGLTLACIDKLNDIDTEADLASWKPDHNWQQPYLSIVIPAMNEADHIENAVEAARSPDSDIIVADGGSQDRTLALAQAAGAKVISTRPGRALQQNTGAQKTRGQVLLFLHADTRLPDNYAAHIFETLMDPDVVAGAFGFKTDYHSFSMRLIEKSVQVRSRLLQMPYGDQALFLPRRIFDQVGGFPQTPIAEDLFLARRLARLGRIALVPEHVVTSGRRWRQIGVWRATLINYIIAGGCLAGIPPKRLAPLYRWWTKP